MIKNPLSKCCTELCVELKVNKDSLVHMHKASQNNQEFKGTETIKCTEYFHIMNINVPAGVGAPQLDTQFFIG